MFEWLDTLLHTTGGWLGWLFTKLTLYDWIVSAVILGLLALVILYKLAGFILLRIRRAMLLSRVRSKAATRRRGWGGDKTNGLDDSTPLLSPASLNSGGGAIVLDARLNGIESEVAALTATDLAKAIRDRKYTAVEVLKIYCKRAMHAQAATNCLTETMFPAALAEARRLDDILASSGKPVGPLHGVPISIKEQFILRDTMAFCGMASYYDLPADTEDGLIVELLRDAGAVPFVKTNTPQLLLTIETDNNIFGVTLNPWNTDRTPGGSSGGEAALIAAGGSPLGIGSDIGGSIRTPSHFCGLYGFKPTPRRVTGRGTLNPFSHQKSILSVAGPIGKSVGDLAALFQALIAPKALRKDSTLSPLPFDMSAYEDKKRLKIGFFSYDGYFPAAPTCVRAVQETVNALRAAGHELVPFAPPRIDDAMRMYGAIMLCDGTKGAERAKGDENWLSLYKMIALGAAVPKGIKTCVGGLLRRLGQRRAAEVVSSNREYSALQIFDLENERANYQRDYYDLWTEMGLDAIICPSGSLPALPHGAAMQLVPTAINYVCLQNLLNTACGTVPITRVTRDECTFAEFSRSEGDIAEKTAIQSLVGAEGLPCGVQVATRPFADELCLRVMKEISELLPFTDQTFI